MTLIMVCLPSVARHDVVGIMGVSLKEMWMVLIGDVPLYIVYDKGKEQKISTTTSIEIMGRSVGYLPMFPSRKRAKLFANKVRDMKIPFMNKTRIVRVKILDVE